MSSKPQKKKRNKKYIPPEKKKCECGSKKIYENCCKPHPRYGPLLRQADSRFMDIHAAIIFEINSILKNLCIESKYLDKLYISLVDMFLLSDEALGSIKDYVDDLKEGKGSSKNGDTYIVDDYDQKFGYYVRHLYVSGGIIKDALCQFSQEIGFNLRFLFGDEDHKKFSTKLEKLVEQFEDVEGAQRLKEFISTHKDKWLESFTENRNLVEHDEFKIDSIQYLVNKTDNLLPQFPVIDGVNYKDFFELYPVNFFKFTREIIIFLLAEIAYREEFMDGLYRGVVIPVKDEKSIWGPLNEDKITYKHTLLNMETQAVETTNFSRNCAKNRK